MKVFIKVLIVLLVFVMALFSQPPDTLWTKTLGTTENDRGISIKHTNDGGYIILGEYQSPPGPGYIWYEWLIKTNIFCDTLWTQKLYGCWCTSIQQTLDSGYIVSGCAAWVDDELLLIKTDDWGDTLWTKTYFPPWGISAGMFVQQTSDSGYIVVGEWDPSMGYMGRTQVWLIKTNGLGDTIWTKTYGDIDTDVGNCVQQTSDGGYIIVGSTESFGAGSFDFWLIKTDNFGDTLWTKTFGGPFLDTGHHVEQTLDEGYIIVGNTNSYGGGGSDAWLIRTDLNGDSLWSRTFGDIDYDCGNSVQQTIDGGFIIVGSTESFGSGESDVWLIKVDSLGNTQWTKTIGGDSADYGEYLQQTSDGGYLIVGTTHSYGAGEGDIWVIRLAPDPVTLNKKSGFYTSIDYQLHQNYPNPFNPTTVISWQLAVGSLVKLTIYNVAGQKVATLVNERRPAGFHSYEWDASGLASGVYLYRLQSGEYVETRKMMVIR